MIRSEVEGTEREVEKLAGLNEATFTEQINSNFLPSRQLIVSQNDAREDRQRANIYGCVIAGKM